ncbi:uncharacterized protein V1510DRAFT_434552 [Dipodascopsis tothii]|uniref:uncharacterized protein n=1 Tax=Dipodascopsis tothii TaxID=44089 RepID=UPI0034CD9F0E
MEDDHIPWDDGPAARSATTMPAGPPNAAAFSPWSVDPLTDVIPDWGSAGAGPAAGGPPTSAPTTGSLPDALAAPAGPQAAKAASSAGPAVSDDPWGAPATAPARPTALQKSAQELENERRIAEFQASGHRPRAPPSPVAADPDDPWGAPISAPPAPVAVPEAEDAFDGGADVPAVPDTSAVALSDAASSSSDDAGWGTPAESAHASAAVSATPSELSVPLPQPLEPPEPSAPSLSATPSAPSLSATPSVPDASSPALSRTPSLFRTTLSPARSSLSPDTDEGWGGDTWAPLPRVSVSPAAEMLRASSAMTASGTENSSVWGGDEPAAMIRDTSALTIDTDDSGVWAPEPAQPAQLAQPVAARPAGQPTRKDRSASHASRHSVEPVDDATLLANIADLAPPTTKAAAAAAPDLELGFDVADSSVHPATELDPAPPLPLLNDVYPATAMPASMFDGPPPVRDLLDGGSARKLTNALTRPTRQFFFPDGDDDDTVVRVKWHDSTVAHDVLEHVQRWAEQKKATAQLGFNWDLSGPALPASLTLPASTASSSLSSPTSAARPEALFGWQRDSQVAAPIMLDAWTGVSTSSPQTLTLKPLEPERVASPRPAETPALAPEKAAAAPAVVDDDWGDFGDFSAAQTPSPRSQPATPAPATPAPQVSARPTPSSQSPATPAGLVSAPGANGRAQPPPPLHTAAASVHTATKTLVPPPLRSPTAPTATPLPPLQPALAIKSVAKPPVGLPAPLQPVKTYDPAKAAKTPTTAASAASTPASATPSATPLAASASTDDDWGDFADFASAEPAKPALAPIQTAVPAAASAGSAVASASPSSALYIPPSPAGTARSRSASGTLMPTAPTTTDTKARETETVNGIVGRIPDIDYFLD